MEEKQYTHIECPDCGGSGVIVGTVSECCRRPNPDGSCCNCPEPQPCQEQCPRCRATGVISKEVSPESATPVSGKEKENLENEFRAYLRIKTPAIRRRFDQQVFDFFWSEIEDLKILLDAAKRGCDIRDEELSRLRSLVKAADEVIDIADVKKTQSYINALENYKQLKGKV